MSLLQASGEAVYSSDVGVGGDQLYARVVPSSEVLAGVDRIDASQALQVRCSKLQYHASLLASRPLLHQ